MLLGVTRRLLLPIPLACDRPKKFTLEKPPHVRSYPTPRLAVRGISHETQRPTHVIPSTAPPTPDHAIRPGWRCEESPMKINGDSSRRRYGGPSTRGQVAAAVGMTMKNHVIPKGRPLRRHSCHHPHGRPEESPMISDESTWEIPPAAATGGPSTRGQVAAAVGMTWMVRCWGLVRFLPPSRRSGWCPQAAGRPFGMTMKNHVIPRAAHPAV